MASFLPVFALLSVFSEKLFAANALTVEEINAFKARPWIEVNTGKQGFVNTTVTSSSTLKILSNGVPDHETGPAANGIASKIYTYEVPMYPTITITGAKMCLSKGVIGVAVNGIPIYNPLTPSDCCNSDLSAFDKCWGKVDVSGQYHYTAPPLCLFKMICNKTSPLIGVALDGFPIYGPFDEFGKRLNSSYLDSCNGRLDTKKGYRYHVTFDNPYIIGCFSGRTVVPHACGCAGTSPTCSTSRNVQNTDGGNTPSKTESAATYIKNLGTQACCQSEADCKYWMNLTNSSCRFPPSSLTVLIVFVQFFMLTGSL